jgi:hypothetical protein
MTLDDADPDSQRVSKRHDWRTRLRNARLEEHMTVGMTRTGQHRVSSSGDGDVGNQRPGPRSKVTSILPVSGVQKPTSV